MSTPPTFPGFTYRVIDGRDVWVGGEGPAVLVIHELPGLHPGVVEFGRRLVGAGFTVWLPSLFGTPGRPLTRGSVFGPMLRVCVSREFHVFATGRTSPIVAWLRRLAEIAHTECGGPGVGAMGMCLTGNFALGMAVDGRMLAPVLSQPATPAPIGERHRADLGISPEDLAAIRARPDLCVLGLRFTGDPGVPAERFATLRRELGDNFIAVEIDSTPDNPHGIAKNAHAVLTEEFVDTPGHPTRDALDRVIAFYRERLSPAV